MNDASFLVLTIMSMRFSNAEHQAAVAQRLLPEYSVFYISGKLR